MNIKWNTIVQVLSVGLQVVNQTGLLPPEAHTAVAAVTSAVQAVVALWAHFRNPDGTPAGTAYRPQ